MTSAGGSGIYLPVMGSFRNFGSSVEEEARRAARNGSRAMANEFTSGARRSGQEAGRAVADGLKSAQAEVSRASQQLTKARDKELEQNSNLARATRDVDLANQKASQTAAAAAAAAERLATAERAAAAAIAEHGRESDAAKRAIEQQAQAQSRAEQASLRAQASENQAQTATERRETAQRRVNQATEEATTRAQTHEAALAQLQAQQARTGTETDSMNQRIGQTGQQSEEANGRIGKMKSALSDMGKAAAGAFAVGGLVGAVTQAINVGNELTGALNNMKAVSGASAEEMAKVSATARQLGNDASLPGTSATKAATAMLELAKGGLSVQQSMEAARGTLALAAAAEVDAGQAAEIQANALNTFGLKADYASKAADILANTANASSVEITDVAQSLQAGGAVAAQYGITMKDTAAAIGVLGNAGIKGSDAGTLLKTALIHLAAPSKQASQALDELGVKAWDANGKFVGMESLFGQLQAASRSMTPELYAQNTAIALGTDAARLAGVAASQGAEGYRKMSEAVDKNGAALEVADAKMQGLGGAWEKVQNSLEAVFLAIYDGIQGPLTNLLNIVSDVIGGATDLYSSLQSVPGLFDAIGAAVGIAATAWIAYNIQQNLAAYGGLINYLRILAIQMYGVAVATRASTVAFLANPMVWVAIAVAALVAAFILLWKNVEGFRNFWIGAWNGIKVAFAAVWNWIKDAFNGLKDIFLKGDFTGALTRAFGLEEDSPVVGFLLGLRDTAINVWNAIVAGAQFLWTGLQAIFGALVTFWQTILFPVLSFLWSNILQPVFSAVIAGAQMLWSVISFVFNAWVTFWTGIVFPILRFLWNTVLQPVFSAVATGAQVLWSAVQMYFNFWVGLFQGVIFPIIRFLWNSVVQPIFSAIGGFISATWTNVISPALSAFGDFIKAVLAPVFSWLWDSVIKPVWDGIGSLISNVWNNVIKPSFELLKQGLSAVGSFFETIGKGIETSWGKVKEYAAKPINFVIQRVWNDGLAKGWNKIADFIPGLVRASTLDPIAFKKGGAVFGPGTSTSDSINAVLSNGEHVWDALDVSRAGGQGVMYAMRAAIERGIPFTWDTAKGLVQNISPQNLEALGRAKPGQDGAGLLAGTMPGFRDGGAVTELRPAWEAQLARAHEWARSRTGRAYVLGGSADGAGGTDCSGYMSGIANVIQGGDGKRQWATMAFNGGGNGQAPSGPQGFVSGLAGNSFSIGVLNGGPAGGHTAGTLSAVPGFGTTNVESGGSHGNVAYGGPAVGADNSQFPTKYHLPVGPDGAFVSGGAGGGSGPSPEQQKGFIKDKIKGILHHFMDPAKIAMQSAVGAPPPQWHAIPPKVFDKSLDGAVDGGFKMADGLGSSLRSAFDKASSVASTIGGMATSAVGAVTGPLLRDNGGPLPPGTSLVVNKTGKDEMVLTAKQWEIVKRLIEKDHMSRASAIWKVQNLGKGATISKTVAKEFGLNEDGSPIASKTKTTSAKKKATESTSINVKPAKDTAQVATLMPGGALPLQQETSKKTDGASPGESSYNERTVSKDQKAGAANKGSDAIDFASDLLNQGVDAVPGMLQKAITAGVTAGTGAAGGPAGALAGKGAEIAGQWAAHAAKTGINVIKGVTKDVAGFFGFGYDEFTDPYGSFKSMLGNIDLKGDTNKQSTVTPGDGTSSNVNAENSINTQSTTSEATSSNTAQSVSPEVEAARKANPNQAAAVMQVKARGGTKKDALTTLMVGDAETGWKNYANSKNAESMKIAHDAVGSNGTSVGFYQQQDSWGSAADRMDPTKSTDLFLNQLLALKDRDKISNAAAAQAVQRSAFADGSNYAAKQEAMQKLLDSLGIYDGGGVLPHGGLAMNTSGHDEYVVPPKAWGKLDDVLNSSPDGTGSFDEAIAKELGRMADNPVASTTSGHGGPLIQIDRIDANDPTEAAAAISKEARRLGRSNSLIGGRT